ncbi:MAG: hypothetical protein FWB71_06590 [Defluviitaleaceae bacterium]|nr:hypothetical protein [Defluviitaleaceae bacterium]
MHNKDKIRIMAKMAVYDKRGFEKDAKSNHYFRHDYIYKKNMHMRFFLGIGCVFLMGFYVLRLFAAEEIDLFTADYFGILMRLLGASLVILVAYSFIGTIIYTREYELAQRRVRRYFALMNELTELNNPRPAEPEPPPPDDSAEPLEGLSDEEFEQIYRPRERAIPYRISEDDQTNEDKPGGN